MADKCLHRNCRPDSRISCGIHKSFYSQLLCDVCLTPKVSVHKLETFYRKVRPGGFWGVVSKEIRDLPGKALNAGTFIDIIGGILLCYGFSLGIGYCLLLKFGKATACFGCAAVGAVWVFRWFKKEVLELEEWGGFREHHVETVQQGDLPQSDSGLKNPCVDD
ncbi:MAG: hypothetical protein NTW55_00185 [Planctomycetota bacterium]|nr:hypothetical protein [Planctomycetota bacterium]